MMYILIKVAYMFKNYLIQLLLDIFIYLSKINKKIFTITLKHLILRYTNIKYLYFH